MKLIVVGFKTTEDNSKEKVSYREAIVGVDISLTSLKDIFGTYLIEAWLFRDVDLVETRFVRDEKL